MASEFIKSAVDPKGYPQTTTPEVAIVGRSNVGKSSLVNALTSRHHLAKVSSSPGKTRLLNFFRVDDAYVLVDLPGYGYSKRSEKENLQWQEMVETYLLERENLKALILVMDARRSWQSEEEQLIDWLKRRELPVILVLNKVDKLNRKEFEQKKREFSGSKSLAEIIFTSALKGQGLKELNHSIFENILSS